MNDNDDFKEVTFTITCTMKMRWAKQFIGMLKTMEFLGRQGSTRNITFYSDGDGDFRPRFLWDLEAEAAKPEFINGGNTFFDAG